MNVIVEKEISGTVIRYEVDAREVTLFKVIRIEYNKPLPGQLTGYNSEKTIGYTTDFNKAWKSGGSSVVATMGYQLPDGTILLDNNIYAAEPML